MEKPFFSIIVVAYNAAAYIRKTIESVLCQSFTDFEIVVKDAASTDGTLAEIPKDSRIRVYSEKDGGIYDGMNAGVSYATGLYCTFLNCGDLLYDENVLACIYEKAKDCDPSTTILYGDCIRGEAYVKQPSTVSAFYLYRTPLNHQSMFFGTETFSRYGLYDTNLKIAADYDYTVRAFKAGASLVYCPTTVCYYLGGGASESAKGREQMRRDYEYIKCTHFSKKERRKYGLRLRLSMPGLRQWMNSAKAPTWVRKLYRKLVNRVNG